MKQLTPEDAAERIDLSQNPIDLRPAVEALLRRVEHVSQSLKPGQPLVVLLGESHVNPVHIAYQLMVLDALREKYPRGIPPAAGTGNQGEPGSLVFNVELPHNHLEQLLGSGFCKPVPPPLRGRVAYADRDSQILLPAVISARHFYFAPVSHHALFTHCMKHGISTRFTDVASTLTSRAILLDENDPWTADLIRHHAANETKIDMTLTRGMHLRNVAMAERALDAAPSLLIQQCGAAHLFGKDYLSYTESLSAAFSRANAAVVPALITCRDLGVQNLPFDMSREMFGNTILIEHAARDQYLAGGRGEADYLKSIFRASGYGAEYDSVILRGHRRGYFTNPAVQKELYGHVEAAIPALFEKAANTPLQPFRGIVPLLYPDK